MSTPRAKTSSMVKIATTKSVWVPKTPKSTPRAKASSMAKIATTKSVWVPKTPKSTSTLVAPHKTMASEGSLVLNFKAAKSMGVVTQRIVIFDEMIRNPYISNMSLLLLQFYSQGAEAVQFRRCLALSKKSTRASYSYAPVVVAKLGGVTKMQPYHPMDTLAWKSQTS
ncbi:hypothetical protein CRG98_002971 [Punica granatum]|uniref:Uncharacterized protein n=1 Tax=Punica granatum TaxID=22663 RepID=A0A2I0L7I6_PUNGR|nr:hypothetical protein CRG98_002971 [Punica granatum]